MNSIALIMPLIGAIGLITIIIVIILAITSVKNSQFKNMQSGHLTELSEEMKREHSELQKELRAIREKVESIDKMMKDI